MSALPEGTLPKSPRRRRRLVATVAALATAVLLASVAPTAAAISDGVPNDDAAPTGSVSSGSIPTGSVSTGSVPADSTVASLVVESLSCDAMTDSIWRLYTAYFLRSPDAVGWTYWMNTYGQVPGANLDVVSNAFADSQEFRNTYGHLSNTAFVDLVYFNVMGRAPDAAGRNHWVSALNGGYPRGSVMIAFSESKEYVTLTATANPMAGFLLWYDTGFRYECGWGDIGGFFLYRPSPNAHFDLLLVNEGNTPITYNLYYDGQLADQGSIPAISGDSFWYTLHWNVPYRSFSHIEVEVVEGNPDHLAWTLAVYHQPHWPTRPGWAE